MKNIVITITLEDDIAPAEQSHVLQAVVGVIQNDDFVEDLFDSISCASCQDKMTVKTVDVQLK